MGAWSYKLDQNDTFLDIYQRFFELYNHGDDPTDISEQIFSDFSEMFDDFDDRNNCFFALAWAQWETKALSPALYRQVKVIIESGSDLRLWKELGAEDKILTKRKKELDKFLQKISTEKAKPKRRARNKMNITAIELIDITSPDQLKSFKVSEHYTNGIYQQTASLLMYHSSEADNIVGSFGGSVFYFIGQGKFVSARWLDSQTIEIQHDKDIIFTTKSENFTLHHQQISIRYAPI